VRTSLVLALLLAGATPSAPTFDAYPAPVFSGVPAQLRIPPHSLARRYRTLFRWEMALGPNFAGHYRLVTWGCGTGCANSALVDLVTGEAFQPPEIAYLSTVPTHGFDPERYGLFHRASSKLLVVGGAPPRHSHEGNYYFVLQGHSFRLLRKSVWATSAAG